MVPNSPQEFPIDHYYSEINEAHKGIQQIQDEYTQSLDAIQGKGDFATIPDQIEAWRARLKGIGTQMKSMHPAYLCHLDASAPPRAATPPVRLAWGAAKAAETTRRTEVKNQEGRSIVVSDVTEGTLVLENLEDCFIVVPAPVQCLIARNLSHCQIHLREVKRSLLIYGMVDSVLSVMNVSQSRIHDAVDLRLHLASSKRPIFESCHRVTLFPPLLRSITVLVEGSNASLKHSGSCVPSELLEPVIPVDFSSQFHGSHSIVWGVPPGYEIEFLDLSLAGLEPNDRSLRDREEWQQYLRASLSAEPVVDRLKAAMETELDLEEF